MSSERTLHIGLIGTGFLARTRVRCYARAAGIDARIVVVASKDTSRAESFAAEHGIDSVATNAAELLTRDDIQMVDLCVPNGLHMSLTMEAAAAGKHVVCTKPLLGFTGSSADNPGDPTSDARAMVRACADSGVKLMYGENWVYAPAIRRACQLHAQSGGQALELHGWESHSGSHANYAATWKQSGGGVLVRLAAHPIGAMLQLKHEEGLRLHGAPVRVEAVSCERGNLDRSKPESELESWGLAILHFTDGTRGIAHGSDHCLGGMQSKLEIRASNALYRCNLSPNDALQTWAGSDGMFGDTELMEKAGTQAGWNSAIPDQDVSSGHQAMCDSFCRDVLEDLSPLADGELGVEVMRVLHAAYLSAASGSRISLAPA